MSTFGSFGTLITPMCRKCNIIMAKRASTAKQVSDMMHLRGQDSELIYHDRDISNVHHVISHTGNSKGCDKINH